MIDVIADMFPNAECELNHRNAFDLTIAVLLSAQCTDNLVNRVTQSLFRKYRTPEDYLNVVMKNYKMIYALLDYIAIKPKI